MARKNLTISLSREDWDLVCDSAQAMGETYSGLFRRLISESLRRREIDPKTVAKYRPLFKSHSLFFAKRALPLAKNSFGGPKRR